MITNRYESAPSMLKLRKSVCIPSVSSKKSSPSVPQLTPKGLPRSLLDTPVAAGNLDSSLGSCSVAQIK